MGINNWFKSKFLYIFREFALYHNESLEFRAKVFASIVSVDKKLEQCEIDILKDISLDIYPDDPHRQEVLLSTIDEYFEKVVEENGLDTYELLIDIENILKKNTRFYKKINIQQLETLRDCKSEDTDNYIVQTRVIEFLTNRRLEYDTGKKLRN